MYSSTCISEKGVSDRARKLFKNKVLINIFLHMANSDISKAKMATASLKKANDFEDMNGDVVKSLAFHASR